MMTAISCGQSRDLPIHIAPALSTLRTQGQPDEVFWPYGADVSNVADPLFYMSESSVFLFEDAEVLSALNQGRGVVAAIDIGKEFFYVGSETVLAAKDRESIEARHAVLVIASRLLDGELQFLVRNSWGSGWGWLGALWVKADYLVAAECISLKGSV